ncbi:Hypothetical predicted protein [Mytilus galloprovincialis]|uniref:DNA-directed DNA polymerase n=1 Tax=Mytilus galloprovincialis TaxID=29158 RepID=A0A8B6EE53_MYTGA|nr:Hypothetical predicted protein [Mytilus galloprovincialis]
MSGVSLELITDPFIYNLVELGTRGGIASINQKYAKANNKYMKDFDPSKPSSHILYTDCENLYGAAMMQPLPTEVDLEYPPELHDHHNCYPLAPTHKKVKMEELSSYSQNLWKDLNGENASKVVTKKLIPTLENKDHYILHYRNLQLYLELGMKVTKIHQIVEFHQSRWLKTYIDFNSQKRKEANNVFEKEFYKLMNNSVFGKTMEDIRRHRNVKLMTDQKKLVKYTSKPSFDHFQIFNQHLVGIENKKVNILLNKPIYVGQAILDISKALMYEFHYKIMKPMYGEDIRLLFTDTGVPIKEFIGLRPKMYSLIYDDDNTEQEKKTAKGIKKCAVKKQLKHANYKECLFQNATTMNSMKLIKSQNYELFVNHIVKKGLSNFDEKRFWTNHIKSYAYGHFKI